MSSIDPFEGITPKTKKEELVTRLEQARSLVGLATTVQTIARVRRKWMPQGNPETIHTVVISATETELLEAAEFVDDLEDVAPISLRRISSGIKTMFEVEDREETE